MFALERQKKIIELLAADGAVWVSKLSCELGVTEETVRRDLEKLEKQEVLLRTHGGAVPIDDSTNDLSLEKRKNTNSAEKEKLAEAASKFIVTGDTVFLDASTTTFYLAKFIKKMSGVTVITTSIRVINELAGVEGIKLIAVGGMVNQNQSFTGGIAEKTIEQNYFASKMFFSCKGITESAGVLDSNEHECSIKRCMLKNSGMKYCICDKSKIGKVGFVKIAPIEDINYFISDGEVSGSLKDKLDECKVEIVKVK
jgi:DeoR/GlpR family transcriptional regulator of sugar metabolism